MINSTDLIGLSREELDTPALLVDLETFENNLAQMATFCRLHQTGWRPHSKSHKSPEIARLQLDAGAIGITCAKLSEAELMVEYDIGPILIANQVVTPAKLSRLATLQKRQEVIVAVDDLQVIALAGGAGRESGTRIPVLIEVDIGLDRVGVQPGPPVLELARAILSTPSLHLKGLMGYEGHVLAIQPREEKIRTCHQALDLLLGSRDLLEKNDIPVEIVSAGGTGCYDITTPYPGITEVQAGGGIFMDAMYRHKLSVSELDYALTVLATVTSRTESHVVVDAGFKTMSSYHYPPLPLDRDDLELRFLSAEHGIFDLKEGHPGPRVGEQVEFVVGYSDSTNFLHDRFLGMRHGRVEKVWEIMGRGLLT